MLLCPFPHHHMSLLYLASTDAPPPQAAEERAAQFKPGIAVTVAILTTVFSLTFLLLMYMKHCKRADYGGAAGHYYYSTAGAAAGGRGSGVDRKVIGSLPMFRFSSLTGHKDGLECAVCLNQFEPAEVLRLLPKCKHAFHVECVDTWLDAHSTCPLCRYRVDPEDVLLVDPYADATPSGSRVSGRHSSAGERGIIPEENRCHGHDFRGRISLDSWQSRRKSGNPRPGRKDGQLPVKRDSHRLEHRIIVSEMAERRRWSDAQATEFLYLRSEEMMVAPAPAYRHSSDVSGRSVINGRSVSEITGLSRYQHNDNIMKNININSNNYNNNNNSVVRKWLEWISQSQTTAGHTAATASSSSIVV